MQNTMHKFSHPGAQQSAHQIAEMWTKDSRWKGIDRCYSADDVVRLRGSVTIEHTLARMGAERLWNLLQTEKYVPALGALTGNQAVQQVQAGLDAIYCSGWQVAADANGAGEMYPDQSLYPSDSVPNVVRRRNHALTRADQIQTSERKDGASTQDETYWFAPIIADACTYMYPGTDAGVSGRLSAMRIACR